MWWLRVKGDREREVWVRGGGTGGYVAHLTRNTCQDSKRRVNRPHVFYSRFNSPL